MSNVLNLSWNVVFSLVEKMESTIKSSKEFVDCEHEVFKLYGVPRGGAIVAGLLSQTSGGLFEVVANADDADLIVDDLIDSGKTREKFVGRPFEVLYTKTGNEWIQFPWEEKHETDIMDHVIRTLEYIGEDASREGLVETPQRVVKSWGHLYSGYHTDVDSEFKVFSNESAIDQIVGLSDIEFFSMCEHHMLPFFGKAHIFYVPEDKICGISKLARVLNVYARRLQNQERLAKQVADCLESTLKPKAVAVILEAQHFCMKARGVEKFCPTMKTSDLRGAFRTNGVARAELFNLINS